MRDYGKVFTSFWTSETMRSMSEDARNLSLYLLTCPHNTIAGVFRLPDGYVCDDMQWTVERVLKAFEETVNKGFANRCETTKWVWINKHIEWNKPENPNQRKSAVKIALSVPDQCCWKQAFMLDCAELIGIEVKRLNNPLPTVLKPEAVTETETEISIRKKIPQPSRPELKMLIDLGVDESIAKDWLAVRKAKRAPLTETVLTELKLEAGKAGITVADAVLICAKKSWQGFNASWKWQDALPEKIEAQKPFDMQEFLRAHT